MAAENKLITKSLVAWVSLTGVFLFAATWLSGCNLREIIPVNTPAAAVDSGTKPRMSLADSESAFEVWKVETVATAQSWAERLEAGQGRVAFVESLVSLGIEEASAAFPGGAAILGLLGGAIGLSTRRPGDTKVIAELDAENRTLKDSIVTLKQAVDANTAARAV